MTASNQEQPERFRLLATFVAGRSVDVAEASGGHAAHTNGQVIFVSAGHTLAEQRREVLIQSALLGAGSLDQRLVKALRGRHGLVRRYLALEGRRVLTELAEKVPLAASLATNMEAATATAAESLETAKSRRKVADPPDWFGVIKPSLLLTQTTGPGTPASGGDLHFNVDPDDMADEDDEDEQSEKSTILKLFETPIPASQVLSNFMRKLLGSSGAPGDGAGGAELRVGSVRRTRQAGTDLRPLPVRIRFTDSGKPGATLGVGGAHYPEWDVYNERYRPQWCRVIDYPLMTAADAGHTALAPRDDVLRRRLSRVSLGPKRLRGQPDGDEIDIEALINLCVDLRSGYSPPEHVYLESRKLARNLGVLILLDTSGSGTDIDSDGLAVHDHQRRAAATLAATLEELGDRVAVYAFRSHGRHAVHLPAIKTFEQRLGAVERARLDQLQPSGFTRLGAGIRGAGEILKKEAGTPNRLLVVLSDGFPYDDGYEGHYAEADARKALEELRVDGVACLCLSIGTTAGAGAPKCAFDSASFASAATLADLSPQMDELFLASLRELSAPKPRSDGDRSVAPVRPRQSSPRHELRR